MSRSKMLHLAVCAFFLSSVSCNIFSPVDSPSGDDQLLSAARAALDQGDYAKALEHYRALSGSKSDVGQSEQAFLLLDQAGVSMAAFMSAFAKGAGGTGITTLANKLIAGASPSRRQSILEAHQRVLQINYGSLRGLVRFISAAAYAAEVLAEAAQDATFNRSDIVSNGTACRSSTNDGTSCSDCAAAGVITTGTAFTLTTATSGEAGSAATTVTLHMLNAAIIQINTALSSSELGAGGRFGAGIGGASSTLAGSTVTAYLTAAPTCYRKALIDNDIGLIP